MAWQIQYKGTTWHEDELTLSECEQVEKATGENWLRINPWRSAQQCSAILKVLLRTRLGKSETEAGAEADALSVRDLFGTGDADGILRIAESTLPTEYSDHLPTVAGTSTP